MEVLIMKKVYVVIIAILVLVAGVAYNSYNRLLSLNEATDSKLAQIEMQLHDKSELIPQLTDSVKEYAAHEEALFSQIAEARAKLAEAKTVAELNAANKELDASVDHLLSLAETYPELKANEAFNAAREELAKANDLLAASRMDYNVNVQKFNVRIKSLPDSIFAGPLGYYNKEYFKEVAGSQNLPEINY